jgi:hypothetical protein
MTRLTAARWWRSRFRSCAAGVWIACLSAAEGEKPVVQPIPFSHKQHAGAGLKCFDCHGGAKENERAGLPAAQKCMLCHASIKADSPAIRKSGGGREGGGEDCMGPFVQSPRLCFLQPRQSSQGRRGMRELPWGRWPPGTCWRRKFLRRCRGCVTCHRQRQVSDGVLVVPSTRAVALRTCYSSSRPS